MDNQYGIISCTVFDKSPRSLHISLKEMWNGLRNVPFKSIIFEFSDDEKIEFEKDEIIAILKKLKELK